MRPTPLHRFDDYAIDLAAREVRHRGIAVDVEAKVFDLIALLLEHRDRALSKREIVDALWGKRPVTDAALSQLLSKARRALGDDGELQHVIRTVHGRGLQWVVPAVLDADEAPLPVAPRMPAATQGGRASRTARSGWLAALAAMVAIAAALLVPHVPPSAGDGSPLPRVAVLPIANETGEADLGWTRNGLMGLIASLLQERGQVEVIGSQIVQGAVGARDRYDAPALEQLRKSLGATHFISGRLRRVGSLYELDLELSTEGATQRRDSLSGAAPTPLAVDAVPRVQRWLGVAPPPPAAEESADLRSPFLAEAYARGLDASTHGDEASAKKYFQICLDQDPSLTWPRLRLAVAQGYTDEADASIENATRVAAAARRSGDNDLLVQALRQLSAIAYFRGDGDSAARHLDEALRLLPDESRPLTLASVHSTYGAVEIKRGNLVGARTHLERALPLARAAGSRRNEAAVLINLAIVDGEQGRTADRLARFREAIDATRECGAKDLEMRALGGLGAAEYDAGHALLAVPMLKQTLLLAQDLSDLQTQVHVATNLARVLASFGRSESAEALIRQSLDIGVRQGNPSWQAKAHWARGILAEQHADWHAASSELAEAHRLFAATHANLDDAAALADAVRIATRGGDAEAARRADGALSLLVAANRGNPELASMQPLAVLQLKYALGQHAQALAALGQLVETNASRAEWPLRLDALLQLGRWRLEQHDAAGTLALMGPLAPWLEQQPAAIELRIAALLAAGEAAQAQAEQIRLDTLKASPDLDIQPTLLAALTPAASSAPPR